MHFRMQKKLTGSGPCVPLPTPIEEAKTGTSSVLPGILIAHSIAQ
jgi:hypothetical protein